MTEKNSVNSVIMSGKYRLINIITASFNTIMGEMTEMSQRKKRKTIHLDKTSHFDSGSS